MVWLWVVLLAVLSLWVGWRLLLRSFVRQYFTKNYAPIQLSESQLGYFPPNHHLQDVPWCSTRETYCQANTFTDDHASARENGLEGRDQFPDGIYLRGQRSTQNRFLALYRPRARPRGGRALLGAGAPLLRDPRP